MQVSYNKLKTFGECALKYRLAYVERLPRPPIGHLAFQRRIHSVLRFYHDLAKLDGIVRIEDLLKIYDEQSGANQDGAIREGEEYHEGEEILRLYCDRENRKGRIPAHLEHKIRAPYGPYTLTGTVDRIDFTGDGGFSIVDYKLDRKLPPANPAAVNKQLSFYQLLVHEGLGWTAEDVRLYYLRHGVEKTATRTREQHESICARPQRGSMKPQTRFGTSGAGGRAKATPARAARSGRCARRRRALRASRRPSGLRPRSTGKAKEEE
jgi:DNA helicase-2/ATP-dependent DNA helicase PcrA